MSDDRCLDPPVPLQEWFMDMKESWPSDLIYLEAAREQIMFVRDVIHPFLVRGWDSRKENPIRVVSTHKSKSCLLPVYEIAAEGIVLRMRGNFHNWQISIEAERPVPDLFFTLFKRDASTIPVYCEGFRDEWVFGSYAEDPKRFTVKLGSQHGLLIFFYLLSVGLGVV